MSNVLEFPDLSHFQAGLHLQPGTPVVLAKASEGTGFTDPAYVGFRAQAAAVRAVFGAYHWVDTSDLAGQAAHAHAVAGPVPMMWDAEAAGATVPRLLELTAWYRQLGGVAHLVYLPRWWWQDHLGSPDLRPLAAAGLGLVSSTYAPYTDGDVLPNGKPSGWAPYGGVRPVQWQYSDNHPYGGQAVDFNAFKGSVAQYRALLYGKAQPMEDEMRVFRATPSGAVWVSNGPQRWHVPDPDTYHRMLTVWGLTEKDVTPITDADVPALGQDVAVAAGGLVPHDHGTPAGTTGPAVPLAQ